MKQDPNISWEQCLQLIQSRVSEQQFATWFKPITVREYDAQKNKLIISVPSYYFREYIEENFKVLIGSVLRHVFGSTIDLYYFYPVDKQNNQNAMETSSVVTDDRKNKRNTPVKMPTALVDEKDVEELDSQLDSHLSFNTFIEGESNKLSLAIGKYASLHPTSTKFNPMFLYGPCGCGKTHLINAIGLATKKNYPKKRVLYVSARLFQAQFTNAVFKQHLNDFIGFYQTIDVLIVDDIQEWINSPKTQDTFFHIFDYLYRSGKRVVLASDRPPVELRGMNERLITRFACGVTTEIDRPDVQLCVDILHSFIRHNGLTIPENVVQYIAESANGSVRDLQGVINSLLAYSIFYSSEIDLKLAEKIIRRSVKVDHETVNINRITDAVCAHYNVSIDDINGKRRKQEIVLARQVVMYLAQKHTEMSASSIGRLIGGRDHSTVLHSCSRIEKLLVTDTSLAKEIADIEKELNN